MKSWQDVRSIEHNWNVYIMPRITVDASGITGKYLDIIPAGGTWRGLRLSLEKNCDETGITWNDSNLKTALYAYGAMVEVTENGQKVKKPLTFADVVWQETDDHPAKPAGQACFGSWYPAGRSSWRAIRAARYCWPSW